MMIMYMNDVGMMLPGGNPVEHSDLEGSKPFGVIIIAIYFFTVQQAVDIEKVQVETQYIGSVP